MMRGAFQLDNWSHNTIGSMQSWYACSAIVLASCSAALSTYHGGANPDAVVERGSIRVTVLTSRIFRIERLQSESNSFVDLPSLAVTNRFLQVPLFEVKNLSSDSFFLQTANVNLTVRGCGGFGQFSAGSLHADIQYSGANGSVYRSRWSVRESSRAGNLGGTISSWNEVASSDLQLQPGLLSIDGWATVNDSMSPLFSTAYGPLGGGGPRAGGTQPWVDVSRTKQAIAQEDIYLLAHGRDYPAALQEWASVAGEPPIPPLSAYGNWYSHYQSYSESQVLHEVLQQYGERGLPLDHLNLDVNWHNNTNGPECKGYNGYAWNETLFPDPSAFVEQLHAGNGTGVDPLQLGLNTHAFEGIDTCNSPPRCYQAVSVASGDAEKRHSSGSAGRSSGTPPLIPINLTSLTFQQAMFPSCLDPVGNDLWWVDGTLSKWRNTGDAGPWNLFWNVYLHDSWRREMHARRPLTMARYSGLGQHRYAIGFSGDAPASWTTLQAEVNMTAKASNVLFGHWSHDIGGFNSEGQKTANPTPEAFARWIQAAVVFPIARIHGTRGSERRPWMYPSTFPVMQQHMRMRASLAPYLYSQDLMGSYAGMSLLRPMYYEWPWEHSAYGEDTDLQFMVGNSLMARPVTQPSTDESGAVNVSVWMPPCSETQPPFYRWNDSTLLPCGVQIREHVDLWELPLYARAGSALPTLPLGTTTVTDMNRASRPIVWVVFPATKAHRSSRGSGASSSSGEVEGPGGVEVSDDGNSTVYESGGACVRRATVSLLDGATDGASVGIGSSSLPVHRVCLGAFHCGDGKAPVVSARRYSFELRGVAVAAGGAARVSWAGVELPKVPPPVKERVGGDWGGALSRTQEQDPVGWWVAGAAYATVMRPAGTLVASVPTVNATEAACLEVSL